MASPPAEEPVVLRFCLASGFHDRFLFPDQQIAATLRAVIDSTIACECLVALSLAQGARDNVTVIVARYETFAG